MEWMVFVCTHALGPRWKEMVTNSPCVVKAVMSNGEDTDRKACILGLLFLAMDVWVRIN